MHRHRSRSRSFTRLTRLAPSLEAQEDLLADFARHYWLPADSPTTSPWIGDRALRIIEFRKRLLSEVIAAATFGDDSDDDHFFGGPKAPQALAFRSDNSRKDTIARWQRFTFYDEVARMSDVLFRGPIDPRHADEFDLQLHNAWRCLRSTIADMLDFADFTANFRVSAVRVAMMLETSRPLEASQIDGYFELPDARTLASLLSLRCEKDDIEELLELYRLVCQKLEGSVCAWCNEAFSEGTTAGLFDGGDNLVVPATVPKVFVPPCGHAIHTLCFGDQLVPRDRDAGPRGYCRRCGKLYAWTSIDVDPMVHAFCLLFGPYVDKRAQDMSAIGELSQPAIISIAEVCQSFSFEMNGLVGPSSAWIMLARRHNFTEVGAVEAIGEEILRLLIPRPPGLCLEDEEQLSSTSSQQHLEEFTLDEPEPPEVADVMLPLDEEARLLTSDVPPDEEPSPEGVSFEEVPSPSTVMLQQLMAHSGTSSNLNGLLPVPGQDSAFC